MHSAGTDNGILGGRKECHGIELGPVWHMERKERQWSWRAVHLNSIGCSVRGWGGKGGEDCGSGGTRAECTVFSSYVVGFGQNP